MRSGISTKQKRLQGFLVPGEVGGEARPLQPHSLRSSSEERSAACRSTARLRVLGEANVRGREIRGEGSAGDRETKSRRWRPGPGQARAQSSWLLGAGQGGHLGALKLTAKPLSCACECLSWGSPSPPRGHPRPQPVVAPHQQAGVLDGQGEPQEPGADAAFQQMDQGLRWPGERRGACWGGAGGDTLRPPGPPWASHPGLGLAPEAQS